MPSLPFILPNTQDIIKPWTYQEKGQSNPSLENVDTVDIFMKSNNFCPLHVGENTEFGMVNNQVQFSTEQSDILSLLGTDKLCVTKNSSQLVKHKGGKACTMMMRSRMGRSRKRMLCLAWSHKQSHILSFWEETSFV